jgi:hypothetical protein
MLCNFGQRRWVSDKFNSRKNFFANLQISTTDKSTRIIQWCPTMRRQVAAKRSQARFNGNAMIVANPHNSPAESFLR